LAETAPADVAASLQGLDHDAAWSMRERLWPLAPDAVMLSLSQVPGARADQLRERWLAQRGGPDGRGLRGYEGARAACRGITGLDDEGAWAIRQAAFEAAPVATIESLYGMASERAWAWRQRHLERAPKAVLSTLAGLDDARAWQMRQAMAPRCREALDSMLGSDHPIAWEIREACLDLWVSSTVKSLGGLVDEPRGQALLARALERHADNLSLLKQASAAVLGRRQQRPQVLAA
jgi:dTMP kinase